MNEAMKKAEEGGYKYRICHLCGILSCGCSRAQILLDPLFWQALGKAEGWYESAAYYKCENRQCSYSEIEELDSVLDGFCSKCGTAKVQFEKGTKRYVYIWHNFIDHLIEGKLTDDFFKELLK